MSEEVTKGLGNAPIKMLFLPTLSLSQTTPPTLCLYAVCLGSKMPSKFKALVAEIKLKAKSSLRRLLVFKRRAEAPEPHFDIISTPRDLDDAQTRERKLTNRQTQVSDNFVLSPKKAPFEDKTDQFSGLQDIQTPTSSSF